MAADAVRREPVASTLVDAIGGLADGVGRLVLLLGEPGMGKTTAARDALGAARRSGATVRWSACWHGGATVAHGPWLTLLSGLGPVGREAMGVLLGSDAVEPSAAGAARASAYARVVAALEVAAAERPVLLVLDDLHWADEGTLHLLQAVSAHLPGMSVLVVATYRDAEIAPGSPLTRLGGGADRIELRGLDEAGVAALLTDRVGAARGAELAPEVSRLTGGNPFLVTQLARLVSGEGTGADRMALPTGARDLLEQRLASLHVEDRVLLAAAAVLGSPFRTDDLSALVDVPVSEVDAALERTAARRIVERGAGTGSWVFVHDLFRQAALDAAPAAEAAALHARAATTLERRGAEPSAIAAHLLAAGAQWGHAAATWSVRAGDRALAAMAWEEGAGHHERALAALPAGGDAQVRADAMAGLGRARLCQGDEAGAALAFGELAELGRALGSPEVVGRAALGFSADLAGFEVRLFDQRQIDLLEEASRYLAAEPGRAGLRSMVAGRLSVALSLVAPDARRLHLAEEAVALARQAGDQRILARALAAYCDAIAGPEHVSEREAAAGEIVAAGEQLGDASLELLGRRLRFVARLERGDVAGVEADTAAYVRRAEAVGNPLYTWFVPLWRGQQAVVAGDFVSARALADEAEVIGTRAGSLNAPMLALVLRLMILWAEGDPEAALASLAGMQSVAPELARHVSGIGGWARGQQLAGRGVEAAILLDRARTMDLTTAVADAEWLPNLFNLVVVAAELRHPLLDEVVGLLEPFAHLVAFEGIGAGLYGSVARSVALGCRAQGRHDDAVRHAEAALAANRAFGGVLLGDALRTLAVCTDGRDGPGPEVEALHGAADEAYRAAKALHLVRSEPAPDPSPDAVAPTPEPVPTPSVLHRAGEVWHVEFAGHEVVVRHSKGIADLAVLLGRPGVEVHVSDLVGVPRAMVAGSGGHALDQRAITAYKERMEELAAEIDDADAAHDLGRAERARVEYDALLEQLTSSVGLGGRVRAAGPEPVERLRKAVTARIREAIRRIDAVHPALGRHLANSVRTGTHCSYRPEAPTVWRCQVGTGAEGA